MGEKLQVLTKTISVFFLVSLISCSSKEDVQLADFDVSRIEGDYSINMKMDFSGPRPEVSVFGGTATIDLISSDNFTLFIDFPDDYITTTFNATLKDKIVSATNSAVGGVIFEIEETAEYKGNPGDLFTVKTRSGETRHVYAHFIEKSGGEVEMNLHLTEKNQTPTTFEFTASK